MNQEKPSLLLPIMWTVTALAAGVNAVLRIMHQMGSGTDRLLNGAVFILAAGSAVYYWIRFTKKMQQYKEN